MRESRWLCAEANAVAPFVRGRAVRVLNESLVEYEIEGGRVQCDPKKSYEVGEGDFKDMCQMTVLNQPQVLRNLVDRYEKDQIFTHIGPTLIVLNPYRTVPKLFDKAVLADSDRMLRDRVPHVYALALRSHQCLARENLKQAIVISGESGAGKTESTKYCMQVLTQRASNQGIEKRILACNPLLQAFGNSKTVRNDNSSRFGKYVQIFYNQEVNIVGANVLSYLLEKSRVVSVAQGQRSFHAFYALTASRAYGVQEAKYYRFLNQSGCLISSHVEDRAYFKEVTASMNQIGFSQAEQDRLWKTLAGILHLGNLAFDDRMNNNDLAKPCEIVDRQEILRAAEYLQLNAEVLLKMILYERKIILKETSFKPFNKSSCEANRNTFCKAVYNAAFQSIIRKISASLGYTKNTDLLSINILDIFGFQNFQQNSLEQLCINFANERLLKEYNAYIFEREMEILREDGLQKAVQHIRAPTNDAIIAMLSSKLSMFSIVNDTSSGQQYKDEDIVHGLQNSLKSNAHLLLFDKHSRLKFTVRHSQCDVTYNADSFRFKNLDKLNLDIESVLRQLFDAPPSASGKTLLYKFTNQIDKLITQLASSSNHFIRCIKPNEKKAPRCLQKHYLLTQIRYLGVFQTIQIRQKTFPCRHVYDNFQKQYSVVFGKANSPRDFAFKVLKELKAAPEEYLLGTNRLYLNKRLQDVLSNAYLQFMRKRQASALRILKAYRQYRFKKNILHRLHLLVKRKNLWRTIEKKGRIKMLSKAFSMILCRSKEKLRQKKECGQLLTRISQLRSKRLKEGLRSIRQVVRAVDETMIVEEPARKDDRNKVVVPTVESKGELKMQSNLKLNESVVEQPSLDSRFAFAKTMRMPPFDGGGGNLQKLKLILLEQYKTEVVGGEEEFFSPNSQDCNYDISSTEQGLLNRIICFDADGFFEKVLRVRKTFIGSKKNYNDILAAKGRPLTKSLTMLSQADEEKAIKVFRLIVRVAQEVKLDNVFRLIENLVNLCQMTSNQLKNEVFLGLLKESSASNELMSVRVYQSLSVFLHIYTPEADFILAGLYLLFERQREGRQSPKEDEYIKYIFRKLIRKAQSAPLIGYMPIKYQMMALMCKRQISVPIYLPVGNSVLIRIESYHTFRDIKHNAIIELGINPHRFRPHHFHFFEIINFQNEQLEQSPINEGQVVWDVLTYWELAKNKYRDTNINPPSFFLMLKLAYPFQLIEEDTQGIELLFAQCYFDYFIGRIRLPLSQIGFLAACVKLIKLSNRPQNEVMGSFPMWLAKQHAPPLLFDLLQQHTPKLKDLPFLRLKFLFLKTCEQCPLALAFAIPTTSKIKLFLKPRRIYLCEDGQIHDSYALSQILRWAIDKEKFVFDVKGASTSHACISHAVYTEHAPVCSEYLTNLTKS